MGSELHRNLILKHLGEASQLLNHFEEDEGNDSRDSLGELVSIKDKMGRSAIKNSESFVEDKLPSDLPDWEGFFEGNSKQAFENRNFKINYYYKLPKSNDNLSIPVFVFHHGAGSSALTFANLAKEIYKRLDGRCAVLAYDARGHGRTKPIDNQKKIEFGLDDFVQDFVSLLDFFNQSFLKDIPQDKISIILVGHSLGGSICTFSHPFFSPEVKNRIIGIIMLDIVEEAAIEALDNVQNFLNATPNVFGSYHEAIDWYVQNNLSHLRSSADISVPSLFTATKSGKVVRISNLSNFKPYWNTWFTNLSHTFVSLPTCKLLILAGNDNLDKELIVGQMQGKYQLVVFQDSGHFIQEDTPSKTALTLIDFWKRNDNKNVSIRSNWSIQK